MKSISNRIDMMEGRKKGIKRRKIKDRNKKEKEESINKMLTSFNN